jgi:hypothetical protein
MIVFTFIVVVLLSPRADAAYRAAVGFAVGTAIAAILAAIVNLAISLAGFTTPWSVSGH